MVNPASVNQIDEYQLRKILQEGLPITSRPYWQIAQQFGVDEQAVIDKIIALQKQGLIKRFGLVLQHHQLGYTANCMVVWDIPQNQIDGIAQKLADEACVTLCYQRPRRPNWPFNLFCMIHGKERTQVQQQVEQIIQKHQFNFPYELLFSTRQHKQRGARYV